MFKSASRKPSTAGRLLPALAAAGVSASAMTAQAQLLPLMNPSFESPDITPDPNDPGNPFNGVSPFPAGWTKEGPTSPTFFFKADTGIFYNVPSSGFPPVGNADGTNLAFMVINTAADGSTKSNPADDSGDFVALWQESTATLAQDTAYAFTIGVGPSVSTPPSANAKLELSIGYIGPVSGTFAALSSLTLDAGDLKDPNALVASDPSFPLLKDFTVLLPSIPTDGPAGNEIAVRARISDPQGGGSFILDDARLVQVLPGDTDFDGDIDDTDLGTIFSNYTGPVGAIGNKTLADGDTDNDFDIDDTDLGSAFSAYTGPQAPAAVPEPTAFALLSLGGLATLRRRR
ncbi:MAG: PEP-CTERM sorting domain-containing protein [Phycisphaeraceae bacterium]